MEKTYTPNEIKCEITEEILNEIKKESQKDCYRVTHGKGIFYEYQHHVLRAREIAFKGSKYKNKSLLYQNLLAANIAFPSDEKLIEVIINHGIDIDKLNKINNPSTEPVDRFKALYQLAYILKKYYGTYVTSLALNRINEIIVFNPELFLTTEKAKNQGMTR